MQPQRRVKTAAEFRSALAYKPLAKGRFFDLFCTPLETAASDQQALPPARIGLVVPKRVCRLAVRRNAFKRMIRESFRLSLADVAGFDCVVRLRRLPGPRDIAAARADLDLLWRAVRRLAKPGCHAT